MSGSPFQLLRSQSDHPNHNKPNHHLHKNSNVRVVCRIKPLSEYEQPIDMKIDKQNSQISIPQPRQQTTKTFTFNRIYTTETQQEFVAQVCRPILQQAFIHKQGYLVFSYGVTNSGKTHTILGSQSTPGILPYLIHRFSQRGPVFLSAIQLYNDEFFSLSNKQKLTPRQLNGFLDFQQCSISQSINYVNMDQKIKHYINNRTQNDTKLNAKSSRSHAIFRIQTGDVVIGVVDLAGSERTKNVFASIDETSNINKSLLCLGKCIKALNQNPDTQQPIPYRESKLTKVLIEYFAAKVQVLMIANINQSANCFHENVKVLDYAVLAKDIRHCTTQNSLKKSQFKFPKTNKIDVFQALYKSAAKSAQAHKSLKSSRSKINDKLVKSHVKQTNTNQKFAKALKSQQLQVYIQKFQSSQQTFDYMVQYMHQKQLEDDQRKLVLVKQSQYQSPFQPPKRVLEEKINVDAAVGRQQKSVQLLQKQIQQNMKKELIKLLEQQRLANMQSKETCIGKSLEKISQKSIQQSRPQSECQISCTPQKSQKSPHENSFIAKTSSAIYSSVKKILSKNVNSMKKILPKIIKGHSKNDKFTICNYGQLYGQLFKFDPIEEQRFQFSFYGKIEKQEKQSVDQNKIHQKVTVDYCTQTDMQQAQMWKYNNETQQTRIESQLDTESHNHQICSNISSVIVRKSDGSVCSQAKDNNAQINQTDGEDSEQDASKQTRKKFVQFQKEQQQKKVSKGKRGRKPYKTKPKLNEGAKRVAQMRKKAARLCRQQSRTPLKKRLRNHQNQ